MNMRLINILPALMLALPAFAVRIEQSLIEINAAGYNAAVRITPTNSAYAPADLSAPIVTGPTRIYTPVAGVLTISNLVEGDYTFEQAGKRLTFTVTNSLPTITNSIRELVSAGLVYGVNGPGFPGVVKVTPNDTVPNVLGAKLVAGDNITITTNNASGNATLTITGAAAGGSDTNGSGSGDALLAGTNIWTGTNIFNEEIQGLAFAIFTNGYGAFGGGLEAPTVYAPGYVNTPIVTNAENGSVVVEGVTFNDGGMDASNILTGTIDAARLPTTLGDGVYGGVAITNASGLRLMQWGSGVVGVFGPAIALGRAPGTQEFYGGGSGWVSMRTIYSVEPTSDLGLSTSPWRTIYTKNVSTTNIATGTITATNGIVASGGQFGELNVTNALLIRSNSYNPTLAPGDIAFVSQEGVPVVVSKDASGVQSTNRLDGVPAGIVTNNHASAVTFSNDVTVASNLVVQGSSTFETLNVGELNVTNLVGSIIDSTNIINGTISSNDIAAGTIGTNLLSQSAYTALVGGGGSGVTGITTNVAVLVPGDLTNTLQFYLGVLTNVVAGVVTNEEPAGTDCVTVAMGDEGAVGAASNLARYSTTLEAAYQFAATNNVDICALSILVGTNASPTNLLRLAIRADSDGTPGAVLAQSDYALPVANEWLKIECAASLTNGGIYWITAKSESYNESNYWWWGNVGYGTSGAVTFTDAYGTNWAATNSAQLNFRIYE